MPDGVFMSASLGGDTLQELRICLNLASAEREGGVSPMISPFLTLQDLGNNLAKCKYTMPTADVTHTQIEFTSTLQLFEFLRQTGE